MSEFKSEDGFVLYSDTDDMVRAAHRAAGWPEPTEEELQHAQHGAEMLTEVFLLDTGVNWAEDSREHRIAKGLSVEAINAWNAYRSKRNALGDTKFKSLGPMPTTHSEEVWRTRREIENLDNPFRQPRLVCIVAADPRKGYPLDEFEDWTLVRRELIGPCGIRVSRDCHKSLALNTMALVHGEFVTVHQVCGPCWDWPYSTDAENRSFVAARVEELYAAADTGVV